MVAAAASAVDRGLMTAEKAVELIAGIAQKLGVEIDPGEELAAAREEATKKAAADLFTSPPNDPRTSPPTPEVSG